MTVSTPEQIRQFGAIYEDILFSEHTPLWIPCTPKYLSIVPTVVSSIEESGLGDRNHGDVYEDREGTMSADVDEGLDPIQGLRLSKGLFVTFVTKWRQSGYCLHVIYVVHMCCAACCMR